MATVATLREPLAFPRWEALRAPVQRRIERLEATAAEARRASADGPMPLAFAMSVDWHRYGARLMHPLSESWTARRPAGELRSARCSREEREAYSELRRSVLGALCEPSPAGFLSAMRRACGRLTGNEHADLRRSSIGLEADRDGTRIEFGPWEQVPERLGHLLAAIRSSNLPPTMTAISAMAVLLNIHPFPDGNGRSARALFNATLEYGGVGENGYLPLSAILAASRAGYEIRLRDAETNGNWLPLIDYFLVVYGTLADSRRSQTARTPERV
jgi:hypothetical protein